MTIRRLAAGVLALVAAATLAGCESGSTSSAASLTTKLYATGHRPAAPALSGLPLLGGGTFNLASERGKVVVLNFWASWCGPCRAEAADIESTYTSSGVAFVGVNTNDYQDPATAFVQANGITYPSIFDSEGRVMLAFRDVPPKDIPSTIVIDAAGKIAAIHLNVITSDELTTMIKSAES
jgi:thiol-disulfide isomerase/thioredoxin